MKVLVMSNDCSGANIALRLKREGCDVKMYIRRKENRKTLDGMVKKVTNWKKELKWVGKNGLVVFDDIGFGKCQDDLRRRGFSVVGGSYFGDRLESDRQYGQKIFSVAGLKILPTRNFASCCEAINFLKKNPGPWVIKQNGHTEKSFNYVGKLKDNRDTISVLDSYEKAYKYRNINVDIQEKVVGPEVAIARYFNGHDWVGPICLSIEHKDLFPGNIGPKTYEMGTLMWYDDNENNRLFQETLAKMKDYLEKINYHGQFDINSILTKDHVYPLEATSRFGYPQFELQTEFYASPWHSFLKAVADGKDFDLKWNKGYGVVNLVACPPFPYKTHNKKLCIENTEVIFEKELKNNDWNHIHFNEVRLEKDNFGGKRYFISENGGYILHVSEKGNTVSEANKKIKRLIDNIIIPKMFYRTDIGLKFVEEDQEKLKKWGWI